MRARPARYDGVARTLHWLIAALILSLVALGAWLVAAGYYDRWYGDALFWHRVLGLLVLPLAVFYIMWRGVCPGPAPVAGLGAWERAAATAAHGALFVLMFALPISGYLISAGAGAPIPLPGGIEIPAPASFGFAIGDGLRVFAERAHYWLGYGVAALAAIHAAAAIKHQWFDGNGVLRRMW